MFGEGATPWSPCWPWSLHKVDLISSAATGTLSDDTSHSHGFKVAGPRQVFLLQPAGLPHRIRSLLPVFTWRASCNQLHTCRRCEWVWRWLGWWKAVWNAQSKHCVVAVCLSPKCLGGRSRRLGVSRSSLAKREFETKLGCLKPCVKKKNKKQCNHSRNRAVLSPRETHPVGDSIPQAPC